MSARIAPAAERFASVDDHLGPAERRFFGTGFRRVGYSVTGVDVDAGAEGGSRVSSTVGVAYPPDWSRKATTRGDLRPHFSTVDAIVLGADLSLLGIADALGLGTIAPGASHLRSVQITAAGSPMEELGALAAVAVAGPPQPAGSDGRARSRSDCRIGTMRVRCEIEHPAGAPVPGSRSYHGPDDVLGPAADRYHGSGFAGWRQHVRDVEVDHANLQAAATLSVEPDPAAARPPARPAGITMVDTFVTALQLGQMLLYRMDGVDRVDSDTLWMRRTSLRSDDPDPAAAAGCPATTRLENTDLVTMAGARWRTADIVASAGGTELRCCVAHRLADAPGRTA